MKEDIFVIYDKDEVYVRRLMKYIANNAVIQVEIQGFSEIRQLKKYLEEHTPEMMLAAESLLEEEPELKLGGLSLILTEADEIESIKGYKAICKFQSCENIMREIFRQYADRAPALVKNRKESKVELIGVFSPVGGCGKTTFALALGQVLAQREKVLYLNLESFSGIHHLIRNEKSMTLAELIFYLKGNRGSCLVKLAETVKHLGNLDYVPPALFSEDLRTTESEIWIKLFNELMKSEYDKVIVDFGREEEWTMDVLADCSRIYVPFRDDRISRAKLEHLEMVFHVNKLDELSSKIKKIQIPQGGEPGDLERLAESRVGKFAEGVYAGTL
ncbi:Cellulose biosynthesis protein BcsQ [Lachnospiraceae bacterium KH1T2]|nr:Cellulose biosynthesis protein BcsQ [Lachnospiraceae bacterium KH1T2]